MDRSSQAFSHSYLGELAYGYNEHTYYSDNEKVQLPLILLPDIVLFPNDVLPMRIQRNTNSSLFDSLRCQTYKNVLGVVTMLRTNNCNVDMIKELTIEPPAGLLRPNMGIARFGVTIEIPSYNIGDEEIVFVAKVRQRFRVVTVFTANKVPFGELIILSDDEPKIAPYCESLAICKYGNCGNISMYNDRFSPYTGLVIFASS